MAAWRGPVRWGIVIPGTVLCLVFLALGVWQVQRLEWKRDLIARTRPPSPPPGWRRRPQAVAGDDTFEYRRVMLSGRYLQAPDTLVRAVTALGAGYWVMTPFRTDQGWTLLVNRGFVAADGTDDYAPASTAPDQVLTG